MWMVLNYVRLNLINYLCIPDLNISLFESRHLHSITKVQWFYMYIIEIIIFVHPTCFFSFRPMLNFKLKSIIFIILQFTVLGRKRPSIAPHYSENNNHASKTTEDKIKIIITKLLITLGITIL